MHIDAQEEMWPAVMRRPGVLHSFSQWHLVWWERLGPQRWIHRAFLQCYPQCLEFAVICSDALGILWRRQDARIEGCFPIDPSVPGSSSIYYFCLSHATWLATLWLGLSVQCVQHWYAICICQHCTAVYSFTFDRDMVKSMGSCICELAASPHLA